MWGVDQRVKRCRKGGQSLAVVGDDMQAQHESKPDPSRDRFQLAEYLLGNAVPSGDGSGQQ